MSLSHVYLFIRLEIHWFSDPVMHTVVQATHQSILKFYVD